MKIPSNYFDAADKALCRAHGDAVSALVKASDVREPSAVDYNLGLAGWLMELDAGKQPKKQAVTIVPSPSLAEAASITSRLADLSSASQGDAYVSAKQPEPAADVWHSEAPAVPGVYIASCDRDNGVMSYWDGKLWHVGSGALRHVRSMPYRTGQNVEWLRLIEADPAKPVQQAQATHSVCIKAYGAYDVGLVKFGDRSRCKYPERWLPCDKDGWVTHEPQADSVCPVPSGVNFETLLGGRGERPVAGGYSGTGDNNCIKWTSGTSVFAWRPVTA